MAPKEDPRWLAVRARDARADGRFVYSVKTTGVYCRPSCAARTPRPQNVAFHATPAAAERGMALILITHDMGVVAETVDRVVVQYAGQQVEAQGVTGLFADAMHPYTAALLAALPERSVGRLLPTIPGVVPGVLDRPKGCLFNPRCVHATEHCRAVQPTFADGPRGRVRCHYPLTGGVPDGHPGDRGLAA